MVVVRKSSVDVAKNVKCRCKTVCAVWERRREISSGLRDGSMTADEGAGVASRERDAMSAAESEVGIVAGSSMGD